MLQSEQMGSSLWLKAGRGSDVLIPLLWSQDSKQMDRRIKTHQFMS